MNKLPFQPLLLIIYTDPFSSLVKGGTVNFIEVNELETPPSSLLTSTAPHAPPHAA